ncbi:hypothetical protein BaRGS_00008933, partial [Batillaria attramentaria]
MVVNAAFMVLYFCGFALFSLSIALQVLDCQQGSMFYEVGAGKGFTCTGLAAYSTVRWEVNSGIRAAACTPDGTCSTDSEGLFQASREGGSSAGGSSSIRILSTAQERTLTAISCIENETKRAQCQINVIRD